MSTSFHLSDVSQLSVTERITLVEQIWDRMAAEQELDLTPAQEAKLDQRLESYRQSPTAGSSWEEVEARMETRGFTSSYPSTHR